MRFAPRPLLLEKEPNCLYPFLSHGNPHGVGVDCKTKRIYDCFLISALIWSEYRGFPFLAWSE